jgi:hypothetical protein
VVLISGRSSVEIPKIIMVVEETKESDSFLHSAVSDQGKKK